MDKININFSIERKEMKAFEYIDFCKDLILKLKSYDNSYTDLSIANIKDNNLYKFKKDLSDFSSENINLIVSEQTDRAYKNEDAQDKDLYLNSKSWAGFSSLMFIGNNSIHDVPDISISVYQGAYGENFSASIKFEYSEKNQSKLTKKYIIGLMTLLAESINVKFANAITNKFFSKVRKKGKNSIGWVNYVNSKIIKSVKNIDIYETIGNGTIFSISDRIPEVHDKSLINKAILISNELTHIENYD